MKAEVSREVELDELRKMRTEFEDAARDVERTIHKEVNEQTQALNEALGGTDSGGFRLPAAPAWVAVTCRVGTPRTSRITDARAGASSRARGRSGSSASRARVCGCSQAPRA